MHRYVAMALSFEYVLLIDQFRLLYLEFGYGVSAREDKRL